MSRKRILIIGIVAVLILIIGVSMNFSGNGEQAIAVQTGIVKKGKIVETVSAPGRIQPKTQVKISGDVSAKIIHLPVKEGQWVEKGQLLVELKRENYEAAAESQEANLRSTQAEAKLARANMEKAQKDYERIQELFEQKLESQANLEAAHATFKVERARYEAAEDRVQQIMGNLKQAQDNLSKTSIYAPIAGTISRLNKEAGEIVLGSQFQEDVIMIISNLSGMEAVVNVDENDVVNVAIGDTARIEVDALPDNIFTGVVTEIANSANISGEGTTEQKTEFEVKIAVMGTETSESGQLATGNPEMPEEGDPTSRLRPGMTASSDIVTASRGDALVVPIQSVAVRTMEQLKHRVDGDSANEAIAAEEESAPEYRPDSDGFVQVVWVVNDGKVMARQVRTGIQSDTHIEILEGLAENDEIVVGNYRAISQDLQIGSTVRPEEKPMAQR